MTGYGEATARLKKLQIRTLVRSVNHRFFNCQINLPEDLSDYASDIESLAKKYITRGSVNISLKIEPNQSDSQPSLNLPSLRSYYRQLQTIQKSLKLEDKISINTLAGMMEKFHDQPGHLFRLSDWSAIEKVIIKALKKLTLMRKREGERLKKWFSKIIRQMTRMNHQVRSFSSGSVARYRELLTQRVQQMLNNKVKTPVKQLSDDETLKTRIAQEVTLLAQRADISEEINRLDSHLTEFRRTINQPGPIGKKLDFIAQEMLREVNTIASKTNDTRITYHTVNLKVAVESIKEQVQNIE